MTAASAAPVPAGQLGVERVGLVAPLFEDGVVAPSRAPRSAAGWRPAGRSRSRTSTVSPGCTSSRYQAAALVPRRSGSTVAAPWITWSLMPSLG